MSDIKELHIESLDMEKFKETALGAMIFGEKPKIVGLKVIMIDEPIGIKGEFNLWAEGYYESDWEGE